MIFDLSDTFKSQRIKVQIHKSELVSNDDRIVVSLFFFVRCVGFMGLMEALTCKVLG